MMNVDMKEAYLHAFKIAAENRVFNYLQNNTTTFQW